MPTHLPTRPGPPDGVSPGAFALVWASRAVVMLLLLGAMGFVPGLTQNVKELELFGPGSSAMILGVFQTSILHNLLHLVGGAVGAAMSQTSRGSRRYLVGGGLTFLSLSLYGAVAARHQEDLPSGSEAVNSLHLVIGLAMLILGLLSFRRDRSRSGRS